MTDPTIEIPASLTIPDDTARSRLSPRTSERPPADHVEDIVSADARIAEFWRKYAGGRITTSIVRVDYHDPSAERPVAADYTVVAEVYKKSGDSGPSATASARRSGIDADEITASRPLESAETAAISRALRFLGILPNNFSQE